MPNEMNRPSFSLAKLVATQNRVHALADGVHLGLPPLTAEDLAIISYALGLLSAERLRAGDRLEDEP